MRISDWSSDVCSSDLDSLANDGPRLSAPRSRTLPTSLRCPNGSPQPPSEPQYAPPRVARLPRHRFRALPPDRKSVVKGKSVSVRVDLGGRRVIKKKHILLI